CSCGAITCTAAPACTSVRTLRAATAPPPITTKGRASPRNTRGKVIMDGQPQDPAYRDAELRAPRCCRLPADSFPVRRPMYGQPPDQSRSGCAASLVYRFPDYARAPAYGEPDNHQRDRKSTRLNSSHVKISYAVFCLKK